MKGMQFYLATLYRGQSNMHLHIPEVSREFISFFYISINI